MTDHYTMKRYNRKKYSGDPMRPDWDSYFMKIAVAVSERSTCDRALVGCVLVLDKRILTTGFNGSPAGQEHCDEAGHLMDNGHCVRTIHAETNAIIQAALHGISTRGSTCYVTHLPCINCTKALINAGITRIVYSEAYRKDENAGNFLRAANIQVLQHKNAPRLLE
jgi:dCMP deaminase